MWVYVLVCLRVCGFVGLWVCVFVFVYMMVSLCIPYLLTILATLTILTVLTCKWNSHMQVWYVWYGMVWYGMSCIRSLKHKDLEIQYVYVSMVSKYVSVYCMHKELKTQSRTIWGGSSWWYRSPPPSQTLLLYEI